MALARLAVVKSLIGVSISTTTYDDLIKNYLEASTAAFQSDIDTAIEKDTYSEYYSVNPNGDINNLYLKHLPVISLHKISMSTGNVSVTSVSLRDKRMYYSAGYATGNDSVRVSYTAGYDTSHYASLGLVNNTIVSYTGYTSINNGVISLVTSFPSAEAITKASVSTGDPSLQIWQWTVSTTSTVNWKVPYDIEQVISEDTAIQLLKVKPGDSALSAIGEGRIGIVKVNRGLYKGSTDQTEFEKYVEGFTARWRRCVTKYRSLWY